MRADRVLNDFARELRKARLRAGFRSAQGFADKIGLEPHTYRKYERGNTHPPLEVLIRICDNLGITPNDLIPAPTKKRFDSLLTYS